MSLVMNLIFCGIRMLDSIRNKVKSFGLNGSVLCCFGWHKYRYRHSSIIEGGSHFIYYRTCKRCGKKERIVGHWGPDREVEKKIKKQDIEEGGVK